MSAQDFVRDYKAGTAKLTAAYGYNPAQEIDSCGVGLVVALDGKRRRDVVMAGIDALKAVWHRGAVDADGKTGDGAGIHVEIPQDFFRDHVRDSSGETPQVGRIAVGMVFLPRTDLLAQERCRTIVETEILRFGHTILGWRQVPVDISVIGEKANATRPEIEQILIGRGDARLDNREFEKQLYILRRRMEKAALADNVPEFYVCSLSCRSVVYKGMFLAEHLSAFYPDLLDERFTSRFAIFHQRYSTNTFPQWKLAQPFRVLAHNGEINTLLGNVNWMKSHEARLEHDGFGRSIEDLKPIIQPDASDSSALDNVFELLVRGHRNLPMVKAMMIPEAVSANPNVPAKHRAMYHYVNGVMEPWDGPAAIAAVAGKWALVGLDRNGLRPMRYVRTSDELLIAGSEAGMVPQDEAKIVEKGRLGPGEMLAVDMDQPLLYKDRELKDMLAETHDYASWTTRTVELDSLIKQDAPAAEHFAPDELRRRQFSSGWSIEDLEMILHPMVEDGKEAVGSMGDDAPLAVLCGHLSRHAPLLPAEFQPGHQPADRLLARAQRHDLAHAARQPRQHPRRKPRAERDAVAAVAHRAQRRVRGDAQVHGRIGGAHRLHLRSERRPRRHAPGLRAHLPRGRGSGAPRLPAHRADRRQCRCRPRRPADDPGGGLSAFLPGAPVAAHLHLAQRALGRVPRRALRRRHHRRRRHHGEPLPRRGDHRRPPCPRPVRQAVARPVPGQLQEGARRRPAQGDVQDGHLGAVVVSRRLQLRGGRPVALAGRRVLPRHAVAHLRHRPARRAGEDRRAACPRLRRGRGRPADRRLLQDAARRRPAQFRGQPHPHAAGCGEHRILRQVPQVQRAGAPPAADQPARPSGLQDRPRRCRHRRGRIDHRAAQAAGGARHLAGRARAGGARDPVDRHEPDRRQVRFGRGRRGSGALQGARQRRQRLVGHQAGGVGPLRRHGGVSQQLPRARDQGRPGRQARRGRPAARRQGERDDRPAAPFDARRQPDQPAAAPRHLFDRGSGAAHLRPEADQPRGAGDGEAGGALGHRHHRGRRRQGQGRCDPDLGPQRRHRRHRRRPASNMPASRGRWACRRPTRC